MLAADALIRLLLVIDSKNAKDSGHGQAHVQLEDAVRNSPAYIFEVRRIAPKDAAQCNKSPGPVILILVNFPIRFDTKGDLEGAGYSDYLLHFHTGLLQGGDGAGFQG